MGVPHDAADISVFPDRIEHCLTVALTRAARGREPLSRRCSALARQTSGPSGTWARPGTRPRPHASAVCINGLWKWQPAEARRRPRPHRPLGLLQGSRLLAGHHRLHAEGLPDGPRASELAGPTYERPGRGVVPARDRDPRFVGRPADRSFGRLSELAGIGVRGRQGGRARSAFRAASWTSPPSATRATSMSSACSSWPRR